MIGICEADIKVLVALLSCVISQKKSVLYLKYGDNLSQIFHREKTKNFCLDGYSCWILVWFDFNLKIVNISLTGLACSIEIT